MFYVRDEEWKKLFLEEKKDWALCTRVSVCGKGAEKKLYFWVEKKVEDEQTSAPCVQGASEEVCTGVTRASGGKIAVKAALQVQ